MNLVGRLLLIFIILGANLELAVALNSAEVLKQRQKALSDAHPFCDKEKPTAQDRAMKYEIGLYFPEGESSRSKIDRKKFCHCRVDARIKQFGTDGASALFLGERPPSVTPETQMELEKKIFIECFKSAS